MSRRTLSGLVRPVRGGSDSPPGDETRRPFSFSSSSSPAYGRTVRARAHRLSGRAAARQSPGRGHARKGPARCRRDGERDQQRLRRAVPRQREGSDQDEKAHPRDDGLDAYPGSPAPDRRSPGSPNGGAISFAGNEAPDGLVPFIPPPPPQARATRARGITPTTFQAKAPTRPRALSLLSPGLEVASAVASVRPTSPTLLRAASRGQPLDQVENGSGRLSQE
jgi:hypothetical protein